MSKRRNDNAQMRKEEMDALETKTEKAGSFQMASREQLAGRRIISVKKKKWTNGSVAVQPPPSATKNMMQTPKAAKSTLSLGGGGGGGSSNPFANTFLTTPTVQNVGLGKFQFPKTPTDKVNTLNAGSTPFPGKGGFGGGGGGAISSGTNTTLTTPPSLKGFSTSTPLPLPSSAGGNTSIDATSSFISGKTPVATVFTEPYNVPDPQIRPVSLKIKDKHIPNIDEYSFLDLELLRRIQYEFQANPFSDFSSFLKRYLDLIERDAEGEDISKVLYQPTTDNDSSDDDNEEGKKIPGLSFGGIDASKTSSIVLPLPSKDNTNTPPTSNGFSFGQSQASTTTTSTTSPSKGFTFAFGNPSSSSTTGSSGLFNTKSNSTSTNNSTTTGGFSFNLPTSTDTNKDASATSKSFGGFNLPSAPTAPSTTASSNTPAVTDDDDNDAEKPTEVLVEKINEDEEVLLTCRVKHSKLVTDDKGARSWKGYSAGKCNFFRHKQNKRCWIVLRNDVGKVLLNLSVPKGTSFRKAEAKKGARKSSILFHGKEADAEKPAQYMLSCRNEQVDEVLKTLQEMAK